MEGKNLQSQNKEEIYQQNQDEHLEDGLTNSVPTITNDPPSTQEEEKQMGPSTEDELKEINNSIEQPRRKSQPKPQNIEQLICNIQISSLSNAQITKLYQDLNQIPKITKEELFEKRQQLVEIDNKARIMESNRDHLKETRNIIQFIEKQLKIFDETKSNKYGAAKFQQEELFLNQYVEEFIKLLEKAQPQPSPQTPPTRIQNDNPASIFLREVQSQVQTAGIQVQFNALAQEFQNLDQEASQNFFNEILPLLGDLRKQSSLIQNLKQFRILNACRFIFELSNIIKNYPKLFFGNFQQILSEITQAISNLEQQLSHQQLNAELEQINNNNKIQNMGGKSQQRSLEKEFDKEEGLRSQKERERLRQRPEISYVERNIEAYKRKLGDTQQQRHAKFMKLIENDQKIVTILSSKAGKLPSNEQQVLKLLQELDEESAKIIFDAIFKNL